MKVVRQAKQEDNCLAAIQNVINCLHINVSNEAIHEVRQQRSYPSVQCILDAFKQWNVNALAVNLDHTHLDKIPCPAIAHTKTDNGHFVVVTNISRESVTCIDPARGKTTVGIGAFLETWTGVTILFSKTKTSGEKDYAIRRQQKADATIRGIGAAAVFIVLTGIALVCAPVVTASTVGLMVAKSAGLWLGLSLLSREFGISSKVLDLFCGAGNSTCDTVLSSPRSKLFHVLGLAELATLYFGGSWLALLLAVPAETDILTPLFVVGISGIPIVMYTLYEQAIRLKKWCALCLLVTAVYVSDITLISLEIATPVAFRIQALIPVVFGFLIPVMLWILLRPRIAGAARLRQNEKILSDFKENPAVFYALLHEKQRRPIPQSLEPVIIGSDHARV
ncbi:MAG TPA: cysteine peptidase family C39 domain-containing protein, partial [Chryseosolibacter sp.]|nr:cysteine peptidase family C39 domain-containing protein [Chryseosolibacter sp.]